MFFYLASIYRCDSDSSHNHIASSSFLTRRESKLCFSLLPPRRLKCSPFHITLSDLTMATAANSYYFRRRTMGRAASPPTWACYEQIRYDDEEYSDSCSDSCSEDEEDYSGPAAADSGVRQSRGDMSDDAEDVVVHPPTTQDDSNDIDMDMGDGDEAKKQQKDQIQQKDVKGKQRAIEPEPESPRRQRKKRPHVYTLRPILTIQRSQGFVWNQVRWWSSNLRSVRLTPSCKRRTSSYRRILKIDVRHFYLFFNAHNMYELTFFSSLNLLFFCYHHTLHSNHVTQMSHLRLHRTLAGSSPPLRHLPTRL